MSLALEDFTPTQRRILLVLDDGQLHTLRELWECLLDPLAEETNVHFHLSSLRRILRERGTTIVPQFHQRRIYYRMITLHVPMFTPASSYAHSSNT
jgi:hypothetical protein